MFFISSLSFSGSFLSPDLSESDQNKDGLLVEISRAAALKDKDEIIEVIQFLVIKQFHAQRMNI